MAVREAADGVGQHGPHLGALELDFRIVPDASQQAAQSGLVGDLFEDCQVRSGLNDFHSHHRPAGATPRPRVRPSHRRRGFCCAQALLILPFFLAHAARKPVHGAGAVEDGAPNAVLRVGLEQHAPSRVKALDGSQQPDDSVAHQVLILHGKPQPDAQGLRDQPYLRHMEQQQPLALRRQGILVRVSRLADRGSGVTRAAGVFGVSWRDGAEARSSSSRSHWNVLLGDSNH